MEDTPTNAGASNAADFQPPTANPQQGQSPLAQPNTNLQDTDARQLLEDSDARISVPVNPRAQPITSTVASGGSAIWWWLLGLVAAFVIVIFLTRKWLRKTTSGNLSSAEDLGPQIVEQPAVLVNVPGKQTKRRKKSKKRKHR